MMVFSIFYVFLIHDMIEIEEFLGFTDDERDNYLERIGFFSKSPARSGKKAIKNLEINTSPRWGIKYWEYSWFEMWYDINSPMPLDTDTTVISNLPMKKILIKGTIIHHHKSIHIYLQDYRGIELFSDSKRGFYIFLKTGASGVTILDQLRSIRKKRLLYNKTVLPIIEAQKNGTVKQIIENFLTVPFGKSAIPSWMVSDALNSYIEICDWENILLPQEYIYYLIVAKLPPCLPKPLKDVLRTIARKEHYEYGGKISSHALDLVETAVSTYCSDVSSRIKSVEEILLKRIKDIRSHYAIEYGIRVDDIDIKVNGRDVV